MYLCADVVGRWGDDAYNNYERVVAFKNISNLVIYILEI